MKHSLTLSGIGLHSGALARVRLRRRVGSTCLLQGGVSCTLSELRVTRTDRGVCVQSASGKLSVDLVEHLFAALSVLGATQALQIEVSGPELPLLDGGSRRWLDALEQLGFSPRPPSHRVARAARYQHGKSSYAFEPATCSEVDVVTEFGPLGVQRAVFNGQLEQFRERFATARTFGFARDALELRRCGRAAHVDPASVLVFNDDGSLGLPSAPPRPEELAEHKLLDLLGDWLLYGALPLGRLRAHRPGHAANHAVFARALADGVLESLAPATGSLACIS